MKIKLESQQRRLLRLYMQKGFKIWLFVVLRNLLMPHNRTIEYFAPKKGIILDYGCGYGFLCNYLKISSPERKIIGTDIDNKKITIANSVIQSKESITYIPLEDFSLDKFNKFDAVVIVDVLPYLKYDESFNLLKKLSKRTDFFIIKDQDDRPRLRFLFLKMQEIFATKIAKYTRTTSPKLCFRNSEEMFRLMSSLGFKTKSLQLKNSFPYPDVMYLCKKIKQASKWE